MYAFKHPKLAFQNAAGCFICSALPPTLAALGSAFSFPLLPGHQSRGKVLDKKKIFATFFATKLIGSNKRLAQGLDYIKPIAKIQSIASVTPRELRSLLFEIKKKNNLSVLLCFGYNVAFWDVLRL